MREMNMTPDQNVLFQVFVIGAYAQKHRAYHNERHLRDIFSMAAEMKLEISDVQKLAIWFHDIVYVPGSEHNEEMSVSLFQTIYFQELEFFIKAFPSVSNETAFDLVGQIIHDTKTHKPSCEESKLVLDLDMAIVGADPERYNEYINEIHQEFKRFSGPRFDHGRATFLRNIIGKRIFNLDVFHDRFNEQAQANMKIELATLGG